MGNSHKITDPSGYEIYLPEELCQGGELLPGGCEELKDVLETPSCIIELPDRKRCYFRSLAWNVTVLISVVYGDTHWEAVSWHRNPRLEYIQQLLQEGIFIVCNSLD